MNFIKKNKKQILVAAINMSGDIIDELSCLYM